MKKLITLLALFTAAAFAQCPSAPAFPGAIATDATLIVAKNNVSTILLAAMASTDSVAVVVNPTGWVANMPASIDSEILFVNSVAGNVLTVSRGCEATTAAIHAVKAAISNNPTAASHENVAHEIQAIEGNVGPMVNVQCLNSANNDTAVEAAISSGATRIYLPANCTWIAPGGIIPGGTNGITYYGGNATTTVIASAVSPASTLLYASPGVSLNNLNALGQGCTFVGTTNQCQLAYYYNGRNQNDVIIENGHNSQNASIGTTWNVTNATNTTPILIGTNVAYAPWITDGVQVFLSSIGGNTAANGVFFAKVTGHTTASFALYTDSGLTSPVAGNGAYTSGGQVGIDTAGTNWRTFGPGDGIFTDTFGPGVGARFYQDLGSSGQAVLVGMNGGSGAGIGCIYTFSYGSSPYPDCLQVFSDAGKTLQAHLDVTGTLRTNGHLATQSSAITLANGSNENVAILNTGFVRITGPTSAFSIGGMPNLDSADGRELKIFNSTAQIMTITNQDSGSVAANRILVPSGSNYVCPHGFCAVTLFYDLGSAQWILLGAN